MYSSTIQWLIKLEFLHHEKNKRRILFPKRLITPKFYILYPRKSQKTILNRWNRSRLDWDGFALLCWSKARPFWPAKTGSSPLSCNSLPIQRIFYWMLFPCKKSLAAIYQNHSICKSTVLCCDSPITFQQFQQYNCTWMGLFFHRNIGYLYFIPIGIKNFK